MANELDLKIVLPDTELSEFISSFWMLVNNSDKDKELAVLPDGSVDVLFSFSNKEPFNVMLMDLDRESLQTLFASKTTIFAVSFKLLAVEYILETSISNQKNHPLILPNNFWDISIDDLNDFDHFVKKISKKIIDILKEKKIEDKKRKLFEHIYASDGSITVKKLSEKSLWSSRQINITLIGDAAHLMPPYAGEGVNMAMLDALQLSESLTSEKFSDLKSAIGHYEKQMFERFAEVGKETMENTSWMHSPKGLKTIIKMFNQHSD